MLFWILACFFIVVIIRCTHEEGLFGLIGSGIASTVVMMILLFVISVVITVELPYKFSKEVREPIVSLRTQESFSGSFILGCGNAGAYEEYYFMLDLGDGKYQRKTSYSSDTLIIETDKESPSYSYEIWHSDVTPRVAFWWPRKFIGIQKSIRNHRLTVPKNTIVQKFAIK